MAGERLGQVLACAGMAFLPAWGVALILAGMAHRFGALLPESIGITFLCGSVAWLVLFALILKASGAIGDDK